MHFTRAEFSQSLTKEISERNRKEMKKQLVGCDINYAFTIMYKLIENKKSTS